MRTPLERPERFALGLVFMLVCGAVLAAMPPGQLARAHEETTARPWLTLLFGFIALAALFGSILVLIASLVGIPVALLGMFLLPVVLVAGYLTGAYVLGRLALSLARARPIEGRLGAVAAVAVGVVLLAVLRLVPILGWLVLIFAVILGLGAWFMRIARPGRAVGA